MLRKLRKSSRVTLVLAGLTALSACSDERHDVYKSREDCLADWGNKPEDCTRATSGTHASSGYWYGPRYSHGFGSGWSRSTRSGSHAISSSSVSRGGFGSSAHASGG